MDLLTELRDDLISKDVLLSVILRKARVLAEALNEEEFTNWVKNESNGYNDNPDSVPNYRVIHVHSEGYLVGAYGKEMKNVSLPTLNLPENIQDLIHNTKILESVAALESLVASAQDRLVIKWPANIVAATQNKFYIGMSLLDAHKIVNKSLLTQLLESIRNRLLEFVLSLRKKYPERKTEDSLKDIPTVTVNEAFKANISGSYVIRQEDK